MYHNQSTFRKTLFAVGPFLLIAIVCAIVFGVYYYLKLRREREKRVATETDRFARYIFDYASAIGIDDDDIVDLTIKAFKWDKTILSVSAQDASGREIENYSWDTHSEAFLDVIMKLQNAITQTSHKESRHYKNEVIWSMAIFFVGEVMKLLPSSVNNFSLPWGTNWYQFSITFPRFLTIMSYLYERIHSKPNEYLRRILSVYISSYLQPPPDVVGVKSMGWLRDGANAVMMAVPYIGGKLLMQTLETSDSIVQYAKNYVSLDPVTSGEGLYEDSGFVFHGTLRAYGYIYSSYEDFRLLAQFFYKSDDRIMKIFDIFEHPTIPLHFSAFFTRSGSLKSLGHGGKLGLYVVDSIKAIVAKTPDWYLSFNGQKNSLCYYESDQSNYSWGQMWIGARQFLYADSETRWFESLVPHYPGVISYNNEIERMMASDSTTTQTHMPISSKTMIVKTSGAIGIRNEYKIVHNLYDIEVVEMMLITLSSGYHVCYKIKPNLTRHQTSPTTVAVNMGALTTGASTVGRGEGYKFDKNWSFVYNKPSEIKTLQVDHPREDVKLTSLQVQPELDGDDVGTVAFSNIHSSTNDCLEVPTEKLIKTDVYSLNWDESLPNTLFLTDQTRKSVTVTQFVDKYVDIINIPSNIITKKYGSKALKDKILIGSNIVASTADEGNQITFLY